MFGGQTLLELIANRIWPPENPRFADDNKAFINVLTTNTATAETVGLRAAS